LTLAFHPYANLFPLIEGQEFYELAEDIRLAGLRDRIDLIWVGKDLQILDGRNRYRALVWLVTAGETLGAGWGNMAGGRLSADYLADYDNLFIYVIGDEETDGDPLAYVLSKNLNRRHLTESQRAIVAGRLANMRQGERTDLEPSANLRKVSTASAAERLNISGRTAAAGRKVVQSALPEVTEAVEQGRLKVSVAEEIAAEPAERQAEILKNLPRDESGKLTSDAKKALAPVMKEIRAEKIATKKEKRAEREEQLGRRLQALPDKQFGVALEDFEYDHEPWSRETGTLNHPSMHYETAADAHTPEEIVARCAERFACLADDCVLFKWTTLPHLAIAIKVMELQGFRYVTNLVWNKERPGDARGAGYWFTGEHELVLAGVRGKVVPPATAHFRSSFAAPVREHSEKPENIHEIIEFHWPNLPKVEFNARRARPGWTAWGFDAPSEVTPQTEAEQIAETMREIAARLIGPNADSGGSACDAADEPALPGTSPVPADGIVDAAASDRSACTVTAVAPAGRPGSEIPNVPIELSEFDALKMISDFCHPKRAQLLPQIAPAYAERGLAILQSATGEWMLRDAGWSRLRELEDQHRSRAPAPDEPHPLDIPPFLRRVVKGQFEMDLATHDPVPPEVVDGKLQTRLPLTELELDEQAALLAIEVGEKISDEMVSHLVGADYAWCTREHVQLTEKGREFLAQLVTPAPATSREAHT
jgi:N6-adenosine-specific RNA methylase IME4